MTYNVEQQLLRRILDTIATVGVNNTNTLQTSLSNLLTELQLKADLTETQPVSIDLTPHTSLVSSVVNTSGTVASGAYSVSFTTSNDFTGSINGVARQGNTSITITADFRKTLPAIPYIRTTGTITIDILT